VQHLFPQVAAHRLVPESEAEGRDVLADRILRTVAVD
jgi:MoxR-like ATPase